jgi:hypothetical protein
MIPHAVYRRTREPRDLPHDLRLRSLEWALYFAADGQRTAGELGKQLRADDAARESAVARLLHLGLIEEREVSASEYVRSLAAAGGPEEKLLHEFLVGATAGPPAEEQAIPPVVVPPRPRLATIAQPSFGFQPLPSPDAGGKERRAMTAETRKLSLRALMNVIEKQAGNREAGRLDIYRVLVRVDTALLKRNGIETLRFTEDRLVTDPELQKAIVGSVKKTLGLECPPSVWVDVA